MVQLFSVQVALMIGLAGLVLAFIEGGTADPAAKRSRSGLFWASIVMCGIAGGLIGGLLNVVAFSLGRRMLTA